jgi:hypothetical protein
MWFEYFARPLVHMLPMTKKQASTLALAAVIGGVVLYVNRDWFSRDRIQISHRFGSFASRLGVDPGGTPMMFEFSRTLKLSRLKVIPVEDPGSHGVVQPTWQLVSDSNSVPTRGFVYGLPVPGMRPSLAGVKADPLTPGHKYRLLIEAGSLKAQHDFALEPGS